MVEDLAEIRGSWPFDAGPCRYLRVVRQHTGVIKQLFSIDCVLGHILKATDKKLQRLPMVGREQFPQWIHSASQ